MNYMIKEEYAKAWKSKYKQGYIADQVGISDTYISLILCRKKACPKRIAYCLTKLVDKDKEITDFFEVA